MVDSMASGREIEIDLARIGGEAEYIVYAREDKIADAYFITRAPVRGFERLVRGKNPLFVIEAVMRICGICHAAHGIAAAEAIEDALGITPPANGRLLREAIGLLNRLQSHITHLILLTPDIVDERYVVDTIFKEIELLNIINDLMTRIGGSPTHPPHIAIGGVLKTPTDKVLGELKKKIEQAIMKYREIHGFIIDSNVQSAKVELLKKKKLSVKPLASHPFYGDKYNIRIDKIDTIQYSSYRKTLTKEITGKTTSLVALYNNNYVEVGPRARLMVYREYSNYSLWGVQEARLIEIALSLERLQNIIEQIDPSEPCRTGAIVFKRGRGIGVYEAPRGTLVHYVELDVDGRVAGYKIVVPTMFNIPYMEVSARDLPVEVADVIPRIYDPCIPCSTHIIRV